MKRDQQENLQKLTNKYTARIDELLAEKEKTSLPFELQLRGSKDFPLPLILPANIYGIVNFVPLIKVNCCRKS